jgi:hypothetical protein
MSARRRIAVVRDFMPGARFVAYLVGKMISKEARKAGKLLWIYFALFRSAISRKKLRVFEK